MINYEKVAQKIFSIIKGHGHKLVMFTEDGAETSDAAEARRFFVSKPNYMITLDAESRQIRFNKNSNVKLNDIESVIKQIKNLATANMLKNEIKVFGKEIAPKDFAYQAKNMKEPTMRESKPVAEASLSRMSGSKKTSYQTLESVKMIVRHRKAVDEDVRGSRSRQISAIFLEQGGERFRFPHNHLAGARAMARHMYEGGSMQDTLGEYIIESVTNVLKLNEFVRYARSNKLINENSEDIVKTVKENMSTIRKELKALTGAKTYSTMRETIESREATVIEENDTDDLKSMFTVRKFDENMNDILPLVKKLMDGKQAWRDSLIEASTQSIAISEKTNVTEDDVFEFENPIQKMGYKIKNLAERMIEQGDLSTFVTKAAGKLIEGNELSEFERTVVHNVLENAIIREAEECVCEDCGEVKEACKCGPKDVVELISDSFELKMKMLEHENIFKNKLDEKCKNCCDWDEDDQNVCPDCLGGRRITKEADSDNSRAMECMKCKEIALVKTGKLSNGDAEYECENCGHYEVSHDLEEGFDPEKSNEAWPTPCLSCGAFPVTKSKDPFAEDCDDCYEEDDDLEEAGDHHAGEVAAGAHSGMPPMDDEEDCMTCGGWGLVSSTGKDWRDVEASDPDTMACPDCSIEDEDDGQPSEYDEWQDYMGGDDWDQGQFDESLNELRKAAGIEVAEVADPRDVESLKGIHGKEDPDKYEPRTCPDCDGDGRKYGDWIKNNNEKCPNCEGRGYL